MAGLPRAFAGHEAGLGKSRILIEATEATGAERVLVVAPAMVLDGHNWDDELRNWAEHPDRWTQVPYTGVNQREKTGTNTSATRPTLKIRPEYADPYDAIVFDEAHYLKGRDTYWVNALERMAKNAGRVYMASGTPFPNWAHELYIPLRMLYPDEAKVGRRFGSYWRWVEEWFVTKPSKYGGPHSKDVGDLLGCSKRCEARPPYDPCDHYLEFAASNFGDRLLIRKRNEVLTDLPPLTEVRVDVPMTAKQYSAYRELKRDFVTDIDGEEVIAWSSGAKNVLLDRLCTGPHLLGTGPRSAKDSGKLARLAYDLSSRSYPTLIVAHYQDTVEQAVEVARGLGLKTDYIHGGVTQTARGRIVRAFQEGRTDCLVGSLETIAEGLTLTRADMCIFVEKSFKPSRNEQAMRRVHRLGQTRPVTVLDYVATTPTGKPTLDGKKRDLLAVKTDRAMRHLTAAQFASML